MTRRYITFNRKIAGQKPSNQDACPFCNQNQLGQILERSGDMIWVENKFPTLEESYQTLVIEGGKHEGDLSNYSIEELHNLFSFIMEKWAELEARDDFTSVVCYRNFGPQSGGSLRHPHTQIVGFHDIDAYEDLDLDWFEGLAVNTASTNQAQVLIATKPMVDFTEFCVRINDLSQLADLAEMVGGVAAYLLQEFLGGNCHSYNVFFYKLGQGLACKLVPRFNVSPYQIGYGIHQVNNREGLEAISQDLGAFLAQRFSNKKRLFVNCSG